MDADIPKRAPARHQPTQKRGEARVEHILDCTEKLILEGGLLDLSTNRIARAADMSIGGIYRYFPDKEAILAALCRRELDRILDILLAIGADRDRPITIASFMEELSAAVSRADFPEFTPISQIAEGMGSVPALDAVWDAYAAKVNAWLVDILERIGTSMPRPRLEKLATFAFAVYSAASGQTFRALGGIDADVRVWRRVAIQALLEAVLQEA